MDKSPAEHGGTVIENAAVHGDLLAFASGRLTSIEEVPDQVFAAKVLGDGIAIWPDEGILRAPADGNVAVVMEESLHACALVLDGGTELLFHIGLDTVDMKGDGFEALVKVGSRVRAGDGLIRFDREKIRKAGHEDVVIMVVTGMGNAGAVNWEAHGNVKAGVDTVARLAI